MGIEMDWFGCTIFCSCCSFCRSRRNFLFWIVRRNLLAQKAWTHARFDVLKRTHFSWRRPPLRFRLSDVPLFGSKAIPRNRFIWLKLYHTHRYYIGYVVRVVPTNMWVGLMSSKVIQVVLSNNRWKERVIEIIKDAVKIEQEFLTDALPVRKALPIF